MKKYFVTAMAAIGVIALAGASGCQEEKYVERWNITHDADALRVVATFNKTYEVNLETEVFYKNFGSINIFSDAAKQFTIDLNLQRAVFGDVDLQQATALPTGAAFPSIVPGPLYRTVVKDEPGKYKAIAYFDLPSGSNGGQSLLVGFALQLEGVNNNFPTVSVSQLYYSDNKKAAAFTVYGPKLNADGKVEIPGGIFIAADLKALQGTIGSRAMNTTWETSPELRNANPAEVRMMIEKALQQAEESGYLKVH